MGLYGVNLKRTAASSTLALGIMQATATPRRLKLKEMKLGSDGTPADVAFLFTVDQVTADGLLAGGTAVTPRPLDSADAAALFDAQDTAISTNPTVGNRLWACPLNQKATLLWQAMPGSELVSPATNNNGFAVLTPTAPGAVRVFADCIVEEQ